MKIFIYDDTFVGLLTAVYDGFYAKEPPVSIYGKSKADAPLLLGEFIEISTDKDKFRKVRDGIINKIDYHALKKIYMVFLSNHEDKAMVIFNYLKSAFKLGRDVHSFLNIDIVRLVDNINRQVMIEAHRFEGFVRFNYIEEKFLYSSIEPDNDILELLGDHFKNRFSKEYFIIHDIKRDKALIYDGISYEIASMSKDSYEKLKSHNDEYLTLWKTYFKSTTIEERKNLKLQSRMMPRRYWKHIIETSDA